MSELYGITIQEDEELSVEDQVFTVNVSYIKPAGMLLPKHGVNRDDFVLLARKTLPIYASNAEVLTAKLAARDAINKSIDQLEFLH